MNRILFAFLFLISLPARADDTQGLFYNPTLGTFQSLTRANGMKGIPDQDFGTFTVNFTGARTVSGITASYVRNGKVVTFYLPSNTGTSCSASFFSSGATDLPASLRPLFTTRIPVQVQNNNVLTNGELEMTAAGQIVVWTSSEGNFTNAANCGWVATPVTYILN